MPLATPQGSSGGVITQLLRLFFHPAAFFRAMPGGSQWVIAALLVLVVTGYTATTTVTSSSSSSSSTTTSQSATFDISMLDASASNSTATSTTGANTAATPQAQSSTTTSTDDSSSDTILMNALIAGCGVLLMWGGQTALLSLVTMMRGYAPRVGKSFQIAVWASLPLALMLGLRYLHYSTGGSGGSLGLSMLLDDWSGYASLTDYGQRIVTLFLTNLTLFWAWDVVLLYLGARYALGGRRITSFVIVALWIVASTMIPALVTEPETRTAPRQTISVTSQQSSSSSSSNNSSTTTTQTQQNFAGGGDFSGGSFPGGGGSPPSGNGGPPGG